MALNMQSFFLQRLPNLPNLHVLYINNFLKIRNGPARPDEITTLAQQALNIIILMPHLPLTYIGIDHDKITRDEYNDDVLDMNFPDYDYDKMWGSDLESSESDSPNDSPRLTPASPQPLPQPPALPPPDNELYIDSDFEEDRGYLGLFHEESCLIVDKILRRGFGCARYLSMPSCYVMG